MIDKAGEDAVALGTDFDGFSKEALPGEIRVWKICGNCGKGWNARD